MTTHTIELDKETKQLLAEVARCIRFISHGEREPAGLEGLSMAIAGSGNFKSDNLYEAIVAVSGSLNAIAEANESIAEAINALAANVYQHGHDVHDGIIAGAARLRDK